MKRLLRGDPEYVIRWYRLILAAALVVGLIVVQLDWPGVITCVFTAALGAAGGSFGAYRSERGLWMLAALYLLIYGGIYGIIAFAHVHDVLRNALPTPLPIIIDATVGTLILTINLQFLFAAGRINWALSNNPIDA